MPVRQQVDRMQVIASYFVNKPASYCRPIDKTRVNNPEGQISNHKQETGNQQTD